MWVYDVVADMDRTKADGILYAIPEGKPIRVRLDGGLVDIAVSDGKLEVRAADMRRLAVLPSGSNTIYVEVRSHYE
jgi:hypothetical protein